MYNVQVHPQNKMQQNQFKWYCCYFFFHFLNNFDWKGNNHKNSNGCNSSRSLNYIIAAQYYTILHDCQDKIRFNMPQHQSWKKKIASIYQTGHFSFHKISMKMPGWWRTSVDVKDKSTKCKRNRIFTGKPKNHSIMRCLIANGFSLQHQQLIK